MVPTHENTPGIHAGDFDVVVVGEGRRLHDEREVQKAPVQPLRHLLRAAAVEVVAEPRIVFPERPDHLRQMADQVGFRAADAHVSAGDISQRFELVCGFLHHFQDFLRPFPEKHPLVGQLNAVVAAHEQLLSQLLFQILELLRQ